MSKFKYSDLDYDKFYSSEHCKRENEAIKAVLDKYCLNGYNCLDLGAGTGLVASLIGDKCCVYQVEIDNGMYKRNPYPYKIRANAFTVLRDFITWKENEYVEKIQTITCVFSLNYMPYRTLSRILKAYEKNAVLVLYDKPYLRGSNSYYAGKKWLFLRKHFFKKLFIKAFLFLHRKRIAEEFNLLNEPYYKVVVLK